MTNAAPTKAFEVGKTYMTRSIGDHNCIVKITVASRTKCFITTTEGKRFRVSGGYYNPNVEQCSPWGSYSMAPTITAEDTENLTTDWNQI